MRHDYPCLPCNHLPHNGWRVIALLTIAMMHHYRKSLEGQR